MVSRQGRSTDSTGHQGGPRTCRTTLWPGPEGDETSTREKVGRRSLPEVESFANHSRFWGQLARGVLGEEVFEGLGGEVVEDSLLAFFPGLVQGAGGALSADAVCHNAVGHAER